MRSNKGFTIVEFLIAVVVFAIILAILAPACQGPETRKKIQEEGYNTLCINGYQFISGHYSADKAVQVIDSEGRGIPCNK